MTTIVAVRKDGMAAIAADTLTTFGNQKESADYFVNCRKIFAYRDNFLATTGWGTYQIAIEHMLSKSKKKFNFSNVAEIFESGSIIHRILKDKYFLRTESEDDDFESSHGSMLIVNPSGIFSLTHHRFPQELSKFYAFGSGSEYAMGAMRAVYDDPARSAEDIARCAIEVAAEFDDSTGLPLDCFAIKLKGPSPNRK
ncbi:MAG TPA: hypothetical protein PKO33_11290 [Pyrinomonadaceae bacterium]|nr:hypothetical protein [Pyrinomonadaceae bacterium]